VLRRTDWVEGEELHAVVNNGGSGGHDSLIAALLALDGPSDLSEEAGSFACVVGDCSRLGQNFPQAEKA